VPSLRQMVVSPVPRPMAKMARPFVAPRAW